MSLTWVVASGNNSELGLLFTAATMGEAKFTAQAKAFGGMAIVDSVARSHFFLLIFVLFIQNTNKLDQF